MWNSLFGNAYTLESSCYESAPSSPPPSDCSTVTLPVLPPELIIAITAASVPPPAYDTFTNRSSVLRSYALVSRTWRPVAQHELFSHVVLSTGGRKAEQLVRSLRERQGDGLAGRVRSIRLGGGGLKVLGTGLMGPLLEACGGVEELWLAGWANFDLAWIKTNARESLVTVCGKKVGLTTLWAATGGRTATDLHLGSTGHIDAVDTLPASLTRPSLLEGRDPGR
mgnify:CR=1 FL=1